MHVNNLGLWAFALFVSRAICVPLDLTAPSKALYNQWEVQTGYFDQEEKNISDYVSES
jgi:hypothetical protein